MADKAANVDGQHGQDLEGYTRKARAFYWFKQHSKDLPYGKIKRLAAFLGIPYHKNSPEVQYLYKLHEMFKVDYRFGLGSRGSRDDREQHHVYACGFVPKSLDRKVFAEVTCQALDAGWVESKNRNHGLIWDRDRVLGRAEWWADGRVLVYCSKPQRMDKVLTLLSHAFGNTLLIADNRILSAFLEKIEWYQGVNVYTPEPRRRLPYVNIKDFENIGIKSIKMGDVSHPYSLEVEWCKPRWNEKNESFLQDNARALEQFNQLMQDLSQPKPRPAQDRSVV